MRKLTTSEFIAKARLIHDGKYSYELVEYITNKSKVDITCPIHGVFEQRPNDHLNSQGCPACAKIISIHNKRSLSMGQFITKAKETHGNKYSYELVDYINAHTKVKITCPVHGVFKQTPDSHISKKYGCPICAGNIPLTTEQFIAKAKETHGNKYSYKQVEYVNNHTKVRIVCQVHGVFEQTPNNHLCGKGCPICAKHISMQELEFTEYIRGIYDGAVITNTREVIPPYELDVYLPDKQTSFEYNGMYWHNEGVTKPVGYHDMKTDMCKDRDITLHHIWEEDWMNNRDEVKERVKELLEEDQ